MSNVSQPKSLIFLFILFIVFSCSEEDTAPKKVLVESSRILSRTANELKTFLSASSVDLDINELKYDVDIYKVTYRTEYKENEIIASGLVILPKTTDEIGMISFQHGTIVAQNEAPTALALNSTQLILYAALGSSGFIGVVPDFTGFGESNEIFHPYYVEEATASSVIDNIQAARDLAQEKGTRFNKKLFLAGYSQGGYATMAAHKKIETERLSGFNLIASFPASGGYDVKGMQEYFFSQQSYDQPYYLAYVALSYQSYYNWPGVIDEFFQNAYAAQMDNLFNGINTASIINDQLTENIPDLIKPELLQKIDQDLKYKYLVDAFIENSLLDWTPEIQMFMYHGDADTTVPYQNSVNTYNYFIDQGASTNIVQFTTLAGSNHGTGVIPFIEDFTKVILELK